MSDEVAERNKEIRVLDWRSGHDPRSRNFRFWAMPKAQDVPIKPKFWKIGKVLNQGTEGACIGFGWTAELLASPFPHTKALYQSCQTFAQQLYHRARYFDKQMGWNWPEGASVLGGAKATKEKGFISEYRWIFKIEELRDAVLKEGPVVIGINWYDSMYDTRPSGLVEIGGRLVGGHCLTVTGYHPAMRIRGEEWHKRYEVFRWVNSWGTSYGVKGTGLIKAEDLESLLNQDGEACVPIGRSRVRF